MNIDPQLQSKLKSIYTSLDKAFKEDVYETKLEYTEKEVPITINVHAVNEHTHHTRMQKIKAFKPLVENWDAFKEVYKNDPILDKIGMEIIDNKMFFNDNILKTITEYPHRKQVLYYFKKGQEVALPELKGSDYEAFKDTILHDVGFSARKKWNYRNTLVKSLNQLIENKNYKNTEYFASFYEDNNPAGKVNCEYGELLTTIKKHILSGDFTAVQKNGEYIVEVPLSGTKFENNNPVKSPTTLIRINPESINDLSIQVGNMQEAFLENDTKLSNSPSSLSNKIGNIRNDSLQPKTDKPRLVII